MRIDWVPFSASALVAGATALSIGTILRPATEESSDLVLVVQDQSGLWMAVAVLYFFSSAALTVGMPSVITLFDRKGMRTGLIAVGVFTVGCVGIAGYAMLLGFIRALVLEAGMDPATFERVITETGFAALLYGWIVFFYLGELLLAVALLRAGTTSRWIPILLLVHVALFPLRTHLPLTAQSLTALLITIALSGVGIAANHRHQRISR